MELFETSVFCPYCGEPIDLLVEPQEVGDSYIEDCQVCCAPINFCIIESDEGVRVEARSQDETI